MPTFHPVQVQNEAKERGIFICNHKEHATIATAPEIMPLLNFLIKLDYVLKF